MTSILQVMRAHSTGEALLPLVRITQPKTKPPVLQNIHYTANLTHTLLHDLITALLKERKRAMTGGLRITSIALSLKTIQCFSTANMRLKPNPVTQSGSWILQLI